MDITTILLIITNIVWIIIFRRTRALKNRHLKEWKYYAKEFYKYHELWFNNLSEEEQEEVRKKEFDEAFKRD